MKPTKLTLRHLRAIQWDGPAPRLAQLAEFINDRCGSKVVATCTPSETNTDRKYKGSRLRWPGKGRRGNALKVNARIELRLSGFLYGGGPDTFEKGQTIFEHDSSETYRYNAEAVRKTVRLVEQLRKTI
jgi:hypothetical protein